ncbi:hypothetical protein WH5701_03209 [Synechococcus sp. WH 5701]|nr:hypothetical protein WH5701_03209 [Synechococcus sp. WH 5701]
MVIPHFFSRTPAEEGYGSTRGDELIRGIALSRCIGSILALARSEADDILDIGSRTIAQAPSAAFPSPQLSGINLELHVFVTGEQWIKPVLNSFRGRIHLHRQELDNPRLLPASARDFLLQAEPIADLSMYLEDDLVIGDRQYIDKLLWFMQTTQHGIGLMPHRYELTGEHGTARLYVDGPLRHEFLNQFQSPALNVAGLRFWDGQIVHFDRSTNPHSGSFSLSRPQVEKLREQTAWPIEGFVGPLESVATYTVLQQFPVWKPSWACREFLGIEHGCPSFLHYRQHLSRKIIRRK